MRLALALGCTISELSERMSPEELPLWMSFYNIEPWGSKVEGLRSATTAATVANAGLMSSSPKKLKSKPFTVDDFLIGPRRDKKKKPKQTWEQQFSLLQNFVQKPKK